MLSRKRMGTGAVIGVAVLGQLHRAKVQATKTQIADFGQALDLYKIDNGRYPSTAEGLGILVSSSSGGQDGYLKGNKVPKDPWGSEYVYIAQSNGYIIKSYGADGREGGSGDGEDITTE